MQWPLRIGYSIAHEQYQPARLLEYAVAADKAGFDSLWSSDHFHPWFHTNAAGGFAWVWMAAAAERTKRVQYGTGVTCPLFRYNPAIVAQAFATLGTMYPGRIFLGIGTGEAMNEVPLGHSWPSFRERAERLEEAIKVIRLLWTQDWVTFTGRYYHLRKANLYTRPEKPIPLYIAASGATITRLAGKYGDGFLTLPFPENHYRDVLFPALEDSAKKAGRDPSQIDRAVEVYVSYAPNYDEALESVRCWGGTLLPFVFKYPVADPREIEAHGRLVGDKQLAEAWLIGTTPEEHIKWAERYIELGFRNLHITSSSPDDLKTIEMYRKDVLPYLKSAYA